MTNPTVRYVIAWHPAQTSTLVSISGSRPFVEGWYRTKYDDKGRQAFDGGPYANAEAALQLPAEPGDKPDDDQPYCESCHR